MNTPPVVHKSYQKNTLLTKLVAKSHKLYLILNVTIMSAPRFSVLFFTAGIGVAWIALLATICDTAIAQTPTKTTDGGRLGVQTMSQVNVLFVNPSVGDDRTGNGTERTPFKTITQALQVAGANTAIMLSSGTYSVETGEKFPLILKPNISIQGDSPSKGRGIVIQGGGNYLSRTFGGQNVTIVGANQAGLTGVTVTNPNPRGYGLWIEYSSPLVVENTFTGSTQDGIAVTGNSTPSIRNNHFYQNGANGITISGNSRPEVRENVFQQTGYGINIAQKAQPIIIGNQIKHNRTGIVVQAKARPVLRNNVIQGNKEDGLVAIAQAIPNLGSASEPGANEFRNNARYDINASAAKQIIPAFGNTIAQNRVAGRIDFAGTTVIADLGIGGQEAQGGQGSNTSTLSSSSGSGHLKNQLLPLLSANSPVSANTSIQKQPPNRTTGLPTITGATTSRRQLLPQKITHQQVTSTPNTSTTFNSNYTRISTDTIEFTAPQLANNQVTSAPVQRVRNQTRSLPTLEAAPLGDSSVLPVPDANIPLGNPGHRQQMPPESAPTTAYIHSSPSSSRESQINLRYRVVVEVQNDRDQELVKFLTPGAFRTVWRGREVMQAGVFSSRYNADSIVRIFNNNGLKAVVEPVN